MKNKKAFTLIELLIVIAILGILAAAILVAINPSKRIKQARDAQRKSDINVITNALIGYYTMIEKYPAENACESSVGATGFLNCPPPSLGTNWGQSVGFIYQRLVTSQGVLKALPKDPLNNQSFFYRYEPSSSDNGTPPGQSECSPCNYYWIGAMLEEPDDPAKPVFRCTDMNSLPNPAGCREVPGDIYSYLLQQ